MKVRALVKIAKTVEGQRSAGGYRKGQEFDLDANQATKWIAGGLVEQVKQPAPEPAAADPAPAPAGSSETAAKKSSAKKKTAASAKD